MPDDFSLEYVMVNGQPGVLTKVEGEVQSVWGFHVREGQIQNAYAVLNPEKLRHVDPSSFSNQDQSQSHDG